MKKIIFLLIIGMFLISGCGKASIITGTTAMKVDEPHTIYGTAILISCITAPMIQDPASPWITSCETTNLSTTIMVTKPYKKQSDFPYFEIDETDIITSTKSKNGNYKLELDKGNYSIFIKDPENNRLYCNKLNHQGRACLLEVKEKDIEMELKIEKGNL